MTRSSYGAQGIWLYVLILLVGAGLRMTGIDYGLPYIRHEDEPNFYLLAQDMRGVLDAGYRQTWLVGYPPGYIWEYAAILNIADWTGTNDINQHMGRYVGIVRAVNVLTDVLTLVMLMAAARLLGGVAAGALAGLVYAVGARAVEFAAIALPDTPTTFFCALTMLLTLRAFQRSDWRLGLLAALAGCLATIFKYPVAPVLLLPGVYFLALLWRERQRALLPAAIAAGLVAATAYFLLVVNGGSELSNTEAQNVRSNFIPNMTSLERWSWTFNGLAGVAGSGLMLLGTLALGIALIRRRASHAGLIALTLVTGALVLGIIPAYLSDNPGARYPTRYVQPAAVLLIVGWAALVAQALLPRWKRLPIGGYRAQVAAIFLLCTLVFAGELLPYLQATRGMISYQLAQRWLIENIPEDAGIWTESGALYTSLSRYDRGFYGGKEFTVWFAQTTPEISPEDKATIEYLYLRDSDRAYFSLTKGWAALDTYPLIKHIGGENIAEQDIYFYLAKPMPNPQQTAFVNASGTRLTLRGINMDAAKTQIAVESYWQADTSPPSVDYSYSLYLTKAADPAKVVAQRDGQLGNRPTSAWYDPEEILRGDIAPLDLPADLDEGDYTVWLAIYYWETGERLMLDDGSNALEIFTLER